MIYLPGTSHGIVKKHEIVDIRFKTPIINPPVLKSKQQQHDDVLGIRWIIPFIFSIVTNFSAKSLFSIDNSFYPKI